VWGDRCVFHAVHAQGPEMLQITVQLESARVQLLVLVVSTRWSTLIRIMKFPKLNLSTQEGCPYVSLIAIKSKQVLVHFALSLR